MGIEISWIQSSVLEFGGKEAYGRRGGEQSLADLANAVGISRQLLHQQFRNHVLKGPSEFRKIVRFRQALALWSGQQREKLTEISTFVNYFDQSHMIRDFKSVTGYTPKRFFSGLSTFGNGTINWFFQPES